LICKLKNDAGLFIGVARNANDPEEIWNVLRFGVTSIRAPKY